MKLDIGSIVQLVDLGLRVGSKMVERHAGKPLDTMTNLEIQAAVKAISIREPDDLIAEGESRAALSAL